MGRDRSVAHGLALGCALVSGVAHASPDGAWWQPVSRAALELDAVDAYERPYSTTERPRDVAGTLALSCEFREGRPCGNGEAAALEVDTTAGYGPWLTGSIRMRAQTGRDDYANDLSLDRGYLRAELGPIAAELGRDVLELGPIGRTQLGWSSNPPPLDHLRVSTAHPLEVTGGIRVSALYALGRLAAPQTYPHGLVSIVRGQLDLGDRVELGAMQLLELGGDGAPSFGFTDFLLEHVRRRDASASTSDSSNRRLGFDLAVRIPGLGRASYQLMFEDLRTQIVDAVRYDADHVLALDTRWVTVELQRTGVRSYEHTPRLTGFTSGGFIAGDPLGPGAQAIFVGGHVPTPWATVMPWAEVAGLSSDTYTFNDDIVRSGRGPTELHLRVGAQARIPLTAGFELAPELALEDVERASFVNGARHGGVVARAALIWSPGRPEICTVRCEER